MANVGGCPLVLVLAVDLGFHSVGAALHVSAAWGPALRTTSGRYLPAVGFQFFGKHGFSSLSLQYPIHLCLAESQIVPLLTLSPQVKA